MARRLPPLLLRSGGRSRTSRGSVRARPLRVDGGVWLGVNDVALLGEERCALREQLGVRGAIAQAAIRWCRMNGDKLITPESRPARAAI